MLSADLAVTGLGWMGWEPPPPLNAEQADNWDGGAHGMMVALASENDRAFTDQSSPLTAAWLQTRSSAGDVAGGRFDERRPDGVSPPAPLLIQVLYVATPPIAQAVTAAPDLSPGVAVMAPDATPGSVGSDSPATTFAPDSPRPLRDGELGRGYFPPPSAVLQTDLSGSFTTESSHASVVKRHPTLAPERDDLRTVLWSLDDDIEKTETTEDETESLGRRESTDHDEETSFATLGRELQALDEVLASLEPLFSRGRHTPQDDAQQDLSDSRQEPTDETSKQPTAQAEERIEPIAAGGMVLLEAAGDPNYCAVDLTAWVPLAARHGALAALEPEAEMGVYQAFDVGPAAPSTGASNSASVNTTPAPAVRASSDRDASVDPRA